MAVHYGPRDFGSITVLYLNAGISKSYPGSGSTWFDLSRKVNNGTLINSPSFINNSFVFNGATTIVDCGNSDSLKIKSAITIESWISFATNANNGNIVNKGDNDGFRFRVNNDYTITWFDRGGTNAITTTEKINPYTWYQIVVTGDSNGLQIYINGSLSKTGGTAFLPGGDLSNLYIARGWNGQEVFNGSISIVKIYNKVLSAIQIKNNYNAFSSRFPQMVTNSLFLNLDASNIISYPGSGTTWTDLSGNNNNGTLTNGVAYNSTAPVSLVFDGIDDYVSCTGSVLTNNATFIVWLKRNGSQLSYTGLLYSRGTNTSGMNIYSTTNNVGYTWNDDPNSYNWNSGLTIPDNTWCMCAITVSATSATAYLCQSSGITSATNNINHSLTTINAIRIGIDNPGFNRYFKGNIVQALFYNRTLSEAEIKQNFNATRGRYGI